MKKKWWILIFVVIIVVLLSAKPLFEYTYNVVWNFIAEQFEKEEQERMVALERGEIITGKDTMLVWNNKYVLYHQDGDDTLCIHYDDGNEEDIIGNVTKYKKKRDTLYLISDEGYVTIDENNLCRVYISVPKDEFVRGYSEDENGKRTYISNFIVDENIEYLDSFNDFSTDEQGVFENMKH